MTDFDKRLEEVNNRLRVAKLRVSVFRRQSKLWLRATLPPKPHLSKRSNYQQAVSIGANATLAGLRYAEQKAKQMAVELDSNSFDWARWIETKGADKEIKTIREWIEEFHEYKLSASKIAASTWKLDYLYVAKRLPQDEILTIEVLIKFLLKSSNPDTRTRKRIAQYCARLAEFAKLPSEEIRNLEGDYSVKSVNPRNLPSDVAIQNFIDKIKDPGWKWLIAIIATYGLRGHEAFLIDVACFPKIEVLDGKTGARKVQPLYPEWAERWNLQNKILPRRIPKNKEFRNEENGSKIGTWILRQKAGFTCLDMRHCYARRCFEFGFDPTQSAKLMGHGWQVHLATYRAWIDEEVYDKAYKQIISKPNRPLPPSADG
jgi:hypothetical protein